MRRRTGFRRAGGLGVLRRRRAEGGRAYPNAIVSRLGVRSAGGDFGAFEGARARDVLASAEGAGKGSLLDQALPEGLASVTGAADRFDEDPGRPRGGGGGRYLTADRGRSACYGPAWDHGPGRYSLELPGRGAPGRTREERPFGLSWPRSHGLWADGRASGRSRGRISPDSPGLGGIAGRGGNALLLVVYGSGQAPQPSAANWPLRRNSCLSEQVRR